MLVSATVSFAQLATALIVVAATGAGFACLKWLRRKLEIADGLAPIPGPKGTFLLGVLPELIRNMSRFNHFQVCMFAFVCCTIRHTQHHLLLDTF
jgi:hypothetical protein